MHNLYRPLLIAMIMVSSCYGSANAAETSNDSFSRLTTQGTLIVNEAGDRVVLKGCNVGNWLLLEMWMLRVDHGQFRDQYMFEKNLEDRFGEAEKDRLMEVYRENWITPRDFKIIRSFGFNVIRLPFNYRLLEDDERPFELKRDAFKWLDRAIEMAEDAGLYVILDMHGVPGGQSVDHPTGRAGQNKLWDDPIYAKRTAWLWKQVAGRYRDRASVAGYDMINEPYTDFKADIRPRLREISEEIYDSIREVDNWHIVFAPAPIWGGLGFYGKPADNGWVNVAFTEHHYPGLFGGDPSMKTHSDFIYRALPKKQAELEAVQTPMLIGEWNPVFENLGGGDLMRRYFDEYGSRGWAATIWSYKIFDKKGGSINNNWHMVTNVENLDGPDFATASMEQIESYFKWFGTMDYVIDEPMRKALTRPDPVELDFDIPSVRVTTPSHMDKLTDWQADDIGDAMSGGQRVIGEDEITIYGSGADIWSESDQFRYVSQEASGDFVMTATLENLEDTNVYAKAGLMARADLTPGSAHVLIHAFPSGLLALGVRSDAGALMTETQADNKAWPIHLRLTRRGDTFTGEYSHDGSTWQRVGDDIELETMGDSCHIGMAVLSHVAEGLTEAQFKNIRLK
jgi:endoglucanase